MKTNIICKQYVLPYREQTFYFNEQIIKYLFITNCVLKAFIRILIFIIIYNITTNIEFNNWNTYIYFKIFILTINFGFFGLPVRVRLITLRVRIFFCTTLQDPFGFFYVSDRITGRIFQFGFGSDFGFYARPIHYT